MMEASSANVPAEVHARFHLLDRQIIDADDRLVAKVDDLELAERSDGSLAVTALLIGPGALGPRLGGRLGEWTVAVWHRLHPDPDPAPGRIPVSCIRSIDCAIRMDRSRAELGVEGLETWVEAKVVSRLPMAGRPVGSTQVGAELDPRGDRGEGGARRISDLLGREVHARGGRRLGRVADVRLRTGWSPDPAGRMRTEAMTVEALIVNDPVRASLLGYERRPGSHPWPLSLLVNRVRPAPVGQVAWDRISEMTQGHRTVTSTEETLGDFR